MTTSERSSAAGSSHSNMIVTHRGMLNSWRTMRISSALSTSLLLGSALAFPAWMMDARSCRLFLATALRSFGL